MGTDPAELLVLGAGTHRLDAPARHKLERDGHLPAAGLFDLSRDDQRIVVVLDVLDVARVAKCEGLAEDLRPTPLDELFLGNS